MNKAIKTAILLKIFLVILVLAIPTISALDWDNLVSYEDKDGVEDKVVVITNWLGLGEEIGKVERITPQVNNVFPGKNVQVMRIKTSEFKEEYLNGLKDVRIKNLKTGKYETKSFYWEKAVYREVDVPIRVKNCKTNNVLRNGTYMDIETCTAKTIGYEKENRIIGWERITENNIPEEETEFALVVTRVNPGDYYDGIPVICGKGVVRWAVWVADLTEDLVYYYPLNNSVEVVSGVWNLENITGHTFGPEFINNADCLISGCGNLTTDHSGFLIPHDAGVNLKTDSAINFWVSQTGPAGDHDYYFGMPHDLGSSGSDVRIFADGGLDVSVTRWCSAGVDASGIDFTGDGWHMLTLTAETNNRTFYIDGDVICSQIYAGAGNYTGGVAFGRYFSISTPLNGTIDEISYYDDSLNHTQVINLFNTRSGLTLDMGTVDNKPSVSLSEPADNANIVSNSDIFNGTCSDDVAVLNCNLWFDNGRIYNFSTSGTVTGQNIQFVATDIEVGAHTWTLRATDNENQTTFGTNRTLTRANFVEETITSNSSTFETSVENFMIVINYTSGNWDSIDADFVYNGTIYPSARFGTGDNVSFKNSIDVPLIIRAQENVSYYWSIDTTDSTGTYSSNSTFTNQSINGINITLCDSAHTTKAINFSIVDEATEILINPATHPITFGIAFEYWLGSGDVSNNFTYNSTNSTTVSTFAFCITRNDTHNINADLVYSAKDYNERTYYYRNAEISNTTQDVILKLISDALGTKFYFTVEQGAGVRIANAVINIDKFYVVGGVYKNIGSRESDIDGKFVEYLELDKLYRYNIVKDGVLLGVVEKSSICTATPCEQTLRVSDDGGSDIQRAYYSSFANGTYSNITFTPATSIVQYSFLDTTGFAQYFRFVVTKMSMNQSVETVCDTSVYSVSGSITCNMTNYNGEFVAKGYISRSPEELDKFITFVLSAINQPFAEGGLGMYAIFFLIGWVITLCFAGAVLGRGNPSVVLIMFIISLISSKLMMLNPFSWVVNTLVILLTALAISKIRT